MDDLGNLSYVEQAERDLRGICATRGWKIETVGYADSTNSRYFRVRKPTDLRDEYDCVITIDADVRLSDHENQSRTSYHDNRLFNVAPGRFTDTLLEFERAMTTARVIDAAEASECGSVTSDNVEWRAPRHGAHVTAPACRGT